MNIMIQWKTCQLILDERRSWIISTIVQHEMKRDLMKRLHVLPHGNVFECSQSLTTFNRFNRQMHIDLTKTNSTNLTDNPFLPFPHRDIEWLSLVFDPSVFI